MAAAIQKMRCTINDGFLRLPFAGGVGDGLRGRRRVQSAAAWASRSWSRILGRGRFVALQGLGMAGVRPGKPGQVRLGVLPIGAVKFR